MFRSYVSAMSVRTKIGDLFTQAERREQHAAFNSLLGRLDETIGWEFFRSEVELAANYSEKRPAGPRCRPRAPALLRPQRGTDRVPDPRPVQLPKVSRSRSQRPGAR